MPLGAIPYYAGKETSSLKKQHNSASYKPFMAEHGENRCYKIKKISVRVIYRYLSYKDKKKRYHIPLEYHILSCQMLPNNKTTLPHIRESIFPHDRTPNPFSLKTKEKLFAVCSKDRK